MASEKLTRAQRETLKCVDAGRVCLDLAGHLVYDTKEVNPQSLAACRRRGWTTPEFDSGFVVLTDAGRTALTGVTKDG